MADSTVKDPMALDPAMAGQDPMADAETRRAASKAAVVKAMEPKMWQVLFAADGHGEQVAAASEADVRALMAKRYGADYAIKSVAELK